MEKWMNFACQQHQKPLKVCYHSSLNEERPRKTKRSQRLRKRAFVCFSNMRRLDPDSARKSMWLLPVHCDPSRWYNQPVETRLFTRRKQYNNYYLNSKVSIITRPKKVLGDRSNFTILEHENATLLQKVWKFENWKIWRIKRSLI